jgi:hypothetical protein
LAKSSLISFVDDVDNPWIYPYPQEFIQHPRIFIRIHPDASMVVPTADGWTADHMKQGYLGMTAHWINVDPDTGKWIP